MYSVVDDAINQDTLNQPDRRNPRQPNVGFFTTIVCNSCDSKSQLVHSNIPGTHQSRAAFHTQQNGPASQDDGIVHISKMFNKVIFREAGGYRELGKEGDITELG
jgi:hypothetical protein